MRVEIGFDGFGTGDRVFLTWAPLKGSVHVADAAGATGLIDVALRNAGGPGGGRVVFDTHRTDSGGPDLLLHVPANGDRVEFWAAGEFQHPSSSYGDAVVEAVVNHAAVGQRELMVRVRKNAVKLSTAERDVFLQALGKLNNAGLGPFKSFRDMHVRQSEDEAHGYPGFPPWHRAYLLDLERELQAIDDTVALPYWRFDEPAPTLFDAAFLGMPPANPNAGDIIQYPHGHALEFWKTDGSDPVERRPRYNIAGPPPRHLQTAQGPIPNVLSQQQTLALGTTYASFRDLEAAPHGAAHVSFRGPINSVPTAAKDPLFFLLHANVDRLWAFWQWLNRRFDANSADTYSLTGRKRPPNDVGHKLGDTMWPWNGSTAPPRPKFPPPRPSFPPAGTSGRPGAHPTIGDMIDYQGVHGTASLGFDYDDVPFELPAGAQS